MMMTNETFRRIRCLHANGGSSANCVQSRDSETRSRIPKTGRFKPTKTWAETEDYEAFRRPRFKRPTLVDRRFFSHLTSEFSVCKTLAGDLRYCQAEPLCIVHVLPSVVAERLFIDVPEKVERLDADIG